MKLKFVNILLASVIVGFSIFFGITNYKKNTEFANSNKLFENQLATSIKELNKQIADDLNQTNKNRNKNNNSSTSPSPGSGSVEVSFNDFYSMYRYAVKKFNSANYVYTVGSGEALFNGNVLGLNINNKSFNLKFTKSKQIDQRYFNISLTGGVIVDGLPPLSIESIHYSDGTLFSYVVGKSEVVTLNKDTYLNSMKWDVTGVFHLFNEDSLNLVKESEIVSFTYDSTNKEYVAEIELNPNFPSNFVNIFKTIANASTPPKFSKINLVIKVDSKGNFKSIKYSESISAKISVTVGGKIINVDGKLETNYIENFITIDNGYVTVKNPFKK